MNFFKHFKPITLGLAMAALLAPATSSALDCTFGGYGTHPTNKNTGRKLTSFTLTDGTNNQKFTVNQTTNTGDNVYYNLTGADALVTQSGATIELSEIVWPHEWMHLYLFVDYNDDGHYIADLDAANNYKPKPTSELVAFSWYSPTGSSSLGYNSKGEKINRSDAYHQSASDFVGMTFTLPDDLTPGKYKSYLKIDWNDITECGNEVGESCGVAVEFYIEIEGPAVERTVTVVSGNPGQGTVSIKGETSNSVTTVNPVTIVASPVKGYSFYNWTKQGSDTEIANTLEYVYKGSETITIVGNFGPLVYPTMTRTYTNTSSDKGQDNRYLKSITTEGTQTPTVFECSSQSELPYIQYTAAVNGTMEAGALISKTDKPIKVEQGTKSFSMTYLAWTNPINGYSSQLNWTQEACYVDWNGDGRFEGAGEIYDKGTTAMGTSNPITTTGLTRTVTIPDGQQPGTYRMRIVFFEPSSASEDWHKTLFTSGNGKIRNGVSYDVLIQITDPTPMVFQNAEASAYSGDAKTGAQAVTLASFKINTKGTLSPLVLNSVAVTYSGTSAADISNLRWLAGSKSVASLSNASNSMNFKFDYELSDGENNFTLVADIAEDAVEGNIVNVNIDKINVNGNPISFDKPSSTGGLNVVYDVDYTRGNALWFDSPNSSSYEKVWQSYPSWYNSRSDNPDASWESKSFPIGNGSFGGNIMGIVQKERVVLNEKSLWKGGPGTNPSTYWNMNKTVNKSTLDQIRTYLENGQNSQADNLVKQYFKGNTNYDSSSFGSFATMGEAYVTVAGLSSTAEDYKRILNMDKGLVVVQFKQGGHEYVRKFFASYPDNVQVWNFSSDTPQTLTFQYACAHNTPTVEQVEGGLIYNSAVANNGMKFAMRVYARTNDNAGNVTYYVNGNNSTITVTGSTNVDFILAADTDYKMNFEPDFSDRAAYVGENPVTNVNTWINNAIQYSYDELYSRHYADYSALYGRTDLKINPDEIFSNDPTPTRLANYRSGKLDHGLEQQYFQYGRYLLISSSRKGSMPANLQGMWHNHVEGAWRVDYHNNINLQMNYWPATNTNLLECFDPLIDYVLTLLKPGAETAKAYYGARGWTAEVSTNIFGFTAPLNSDGMSWNYNPTAGPWLATQIWEYYDYTRDKNWLNNTGYKIIKGAADFCSDLLYMTSKGYSSAPSYSPEHGTVDLGATYANAVTREILKDAIAAAQILDKDPESVKEWQEKLDGMYPYQIGGQGQLQEWYYDIDAQVARQDGELHRHTNHLFGLHPGSTINVLEQTDLADACKATLRQRGDEATGWSMGWKLNHWARLLDGNHAYTLFQNLLKQGTYDNMWDKHPPFQIDGNFGGTAGIAELFLQSHNGFLHILPALPDAWKDGQITGLLARGNFEVDIFYKNNALDHALIRSKSGEHCSVYYDGEKLDFDTETGAEYNVSLDDQGKLSVKETDGENGGDEGGEGGEDPEKDYSLSFGSISLEVNPAEDAVEAHVYAALTTGADLNDADIDVAYRLNDEKYVAMNYVAEKDYHYGYIPFDGLAVGDYDVYVKAYASKDGEQLAEEEQLAGQFSVRSIPDGINDVVADIASGARYFNLQGVEVTSPTPGFYIRLLGDTAVKVHVNN